MNEDKINNKMEIHKCVLCYDAPCTKIYKNINPERIIRALKFDNKKGARILIDDSNTCFEKNECSLKCPLNINIDGIVNSLLTEDKVTDINSVDISTEICGIKLENPFMLSSSIVGSTYEMCKRAFEQGWGGICTKTICVII